MPISVATTALLFAFLLNDSHPTNTCWMSSIARRLFGHRPSAVTSAFLHQTYYPSRRYSITPPPPLLLHASPAAGLTDDPEDRLLHGLNANQIEAVTQPPRAIVRVIAGPGSGKTRVLTARMAYLLWTTRSDNRLLAVTFTKKAALEMEQRVRRILIGDDGNDGDEEETITAMRRRMTVGTFHSVCAKILRYNGHLLATLPSVQADMARPAANTNGTLLLLNGEFTIVDAAEQERNVKEALAARKIDLKTDYYTEIRVKQVVGMLGKCKAAMADGQDPFLVQKGDKPGPLQDVASKIYYICREKLLSTNCLDFDDLILLARELLRHHPEVRQRLQNYWTHLLVDEFQDTSQHQMDVVKYLTQSSLLIVGDADQSIYSWRGAHSGSLYDFEEQFESFHVNGVKTVYLMENYRSTGSIVKAAQKVIGTSGSTTTGTDKLRQEMIPQREKGGPPRIIACPDGKAEASYVIDKIKERIDNGEYGTDRSVAIIYRTNAQSRELEEACVRTSVPYVIFGSATSFYKRQEIKDCLCFLRWLYNGQDRESMVRALQTPRKGIGEAAIREFEAYYTLLGDEWNAVSSKVGKRPSPLDALCHLGGDSRWIDMQPQDIPPPGTFLGTRSLRPLSTFGTQMVKIRLLSETATVDSLLTHVIEELDLMAHLEKLSKSDAEFQERKANVNELLQASRRYAGNGPSQAIAATESGNSTDDDEMFQQSSLALFLDDVALVTEIADENSESSGDGRLVVSFMTIHASKGMEFDTVFLVGLEDGTVPTYQALQEGEKSTVYREERRLVYVAMTRAKSELVMSWRKEVPIFTKEGLKFLPRNRSRFLDSLSKPKKGNDEKSPEIQSSGGRSTRPGTAAPTRQLNGSRAHSRYQSTARSNQWKAAASRRVSPNTEAQQSNEPSRIKPVASGTHKSTARGGLSSNSPRQIHTQRMETVRRPRKQVVQPPDASWIFPAGSKVEHARFGLGVVLLADGENQSHVQVQFADGETKKFPVDGTELFPSSD